MSWSSCRYCVLFHSLHPRPDQDASVRRRTFGGSTAVASAVSDDAFSRDAGLKGHDLRPRSPVAYAKDAVICVALLVVGLYTRLWNIADPRNQVFDETHFTKFSTW